MFSDWHWLISRGSRFHTFGAAFQTPYPRPIPECLNKLICDSSAYPTSSETQGQSVGPGEKARRKFSSMGGRAPGYRLSPDHFQTAKRMHWFLIGHKKCFVLLCPIGEQHLLSSFRGFVHDGYYLATVARFVHQAFLTINEGSTDETKNVLDTISSSRFAPRKFCFWRITMYRK